ncbi:hypothetical protein [Nannocystis exedens]|uniref:hypothetical protein n=1 Tax=Nannocystis exedens TaxID=54 RepID=UPI000BBA00DA|nr:hypothetical protein [Nannocystis exedens]
MEHLAPGPAFEGMPAEFVRWFVGDRVADLLAVPSTRERSPLIDLWRMFGRFGDRRDHAARAILSARLRIEPGEPASDGLGNLVRRAGEPAGPTS